MSWVIIHDRKAWCDLENSICNFDRTLVLFFVLSGGEVGVVDMISRPKKTKQLEPLIDLVPKFS